jgi:hypothetical protein
LQRGKLIYPAQPRGKFRLLYAINPNGLTKNPCLTTQKQILAKSQAIWKQRELLDRHNYPNGVLCTDLRADKLGLEQLKKHTFLEKENQI